MTDDTDDGFPSRNFNWIDDRADIVIHEQAAVAVFYNPRGDLVVRQAAQYHEDEDHWIVVTLESAERLAHAILDKLHDAGLRATAETKPQSSNAVRQRRYRQRQRQRDATPTVTRDGADRNAVTPSSPQPLLFDASKGDEAQRAH